ncbi:MAG: hypothetical protein WCL38_05985 [Actinomycetota bacterium]
MWRKGMAALIAAAAVCVPVSVLGSAPASAAQYADPASDNCKTYSGTGQWCGQDISSAEDPTVSGAVHLIVKTDLAHCVGNESNSAGTVRFGIFKSSATSPNWNDELGEIYADYGTNTFAYHAGSSRTALVASVQSSSMTTTYDVTLSSAFTSGFDSGFTWMVGNDCIGEGPWEASDIAPNSGLYKVVLSSAPSVPASPTGIVAKAGSTTSAITGPLVASYITGANNGSPITKFTASCTSSNGGVAQTAMHTGATAVPISLNGATLKKTYTCTVRATNSAGTCAASTPSAPVTVGAPARMTTPTTTKIAAGTLKVSFTTLSSTLTNGSPLSAPNYTVTCTSSNGGTPRSVTGTLSPVTVAKLSPGKVYLCSVKPHNARGFGAASPSSMPRSA